MATTKEQEVTGNPLVDALPPATDYITYLTLLEYQLTAQNLSTLNSLLSEDDGTLAAEIGWDLLKLVLPMLQVVPDEASKCLDIIARRGNPREVVVRVSEELERLRQDDDGSSHNSDVESQGEEQDELPTFAGEATRVHLGTMTLDGATQPLVTEDDSSKPTSQEMHDNGASHGSDNSTLFQALLSMLSILHPRIKTQYPSRFLATSLPAALGAYRHLSITQDTTIAFITALRKLSGRQRPTLPPRVSTAGCAPTVQADQNAKMVSLRDPESVEDSGELSKDDSSVLMVKEKDIIDRLLQAVMLEVLDDYAQSFQAFEISSPRWTTRARERSQPHRIVPGRSTETQNWQREPDLQMRDTILKQFARLGMELSINCARAIDMMLNLSGKKASDEEVKHDDEPAMDYPTSPADIPFPIAGLVMLYAAQKFYYPDNSSSGQELSLQQTLQLLRKICLPDRQQSLAEIDAIHLLLYTSITTKQLNDHVEIVHPDDILVSLQDLADIFTTNFDPSTRDNAHLVATKVFHEQADASTKIAYLKFLMSADTEPASPIHSVQAGNLKAIAINWLKDEVLSGGLDVNIISTNTELRSQVLPVLPVVPGPFISSHPQTSSAAKTALSTDDALEGFLLHIPAYIAALNLLSVLAHLLDESPEDPATSHGEHSSRTTSKSALSGPLLSQADDFVGELEAWTNTLLGLLISMNKSGGDGPISLADVYALEDACKRARAGIMHAEE